MNNLKDNLTPGRQIMLQLDFAENYIRLITFNQNQ